MKFILLAAALILSIIRCEGQAPNANRQFPVFDAVSFAHKPDLTVFGLKPITVVYPNFMWKENKVPDSTSLPDRSRIVAFGQLANQTSHVLAIDIEHWPLTGNPTTVAASIKKYQTVIGWYKATTAPELKIGFYGVTQLRNYWDSIQEKNSPRYLAWQKQNDALASVAQLEDVLFPSVYTFYDDRRGWEKYAIAQIQEARRYAGRKPVYVFLWPQYHGSNKKLDNAFLAGDYWRMELETARKYADGLVIWCCSTKQTWDENAAWWSETKTFLKELDKANN